MNVDEIRKYCLSFPATSEKLQWGDALCFKVKAKMFAVIGLDRVRFTFKCTPETFAELIELEGIHRAPHVGRYNWVMLDQLDALRRAELEDLIRQSYDMVAAKVPKTRAKRKVSSGKKSGKKGSVAHKTRAKRR